MSSEDLGDVYARAVSQPAGAIHPDEAQWDRVFSNEATRDERRELMAHVVSCAACADLYRRLIVLRQEAAAFDPGAPRPMHTGFWAGLLGRPTAAPRRMVYLTAGIVAAVAVVAVTVTWQAWRTEPGARSTAQTTSPSVAPTVSLGEDPAFRLEKPPVILSAVLALTPRGAAEDPQAFLAALGSALDPYRADDFPEAARRLEALSGRYPDAVEPTLYAGISLLMASRPIDAVPRLERARSRATGDLQIEASWALSLAYVHAGDPGKARPELQHLCSDANPHQTRACEALRALPPPR